MQEAAPNFGKYRLIQRIATGGMAEVWSAEMFVGGGAKPVVVKKILPGLAEDPDFVHMFINEARLAMSLSHGNIAQTYDFGQVDGDYFIAMEHVRGPALADLLYRLRKVQQSVPDAFAAYIAMGVSNGLHYAHTLRGDDGQPLSIVHRDVSPENILVAYEGLVKVVDFGLAKARTVTVMTRPGTLKGKFAYFSPEQARGGELDARSDVFATGTLLYELTTNALPFDGTLDQVLKKLDRGDFERPSKRVALDAELEDVILRAMARRPDNRFQSSAEMAGALDQVLARLAPGLGPEQVGRWVQTVLPPEEMAENAESRQFTEFGGDEVLTRSGEERARAGSRPYDLDRPGSDLTTSPAARRTRRMALGAVLLVGVAIAGGSLAFALRPRSLGQVRITSYPPGAAIYVDGRSTPIATGAAGGTLLSELGAGDHEIRLKSLGYEDYVAHLTLNPSDDHSWKEQRIDAELQRVVEKEPPRPPPPEPPPETPADGFRAITDVEVQKVLNVPGSHAARVELKPEHAYDLRIAGQAVIGTNFLNINRGGKVEIEGRTVWWYTRGPKGAAAGIVRPRSPARLTDAREVFLFVIDWACEDNKGGFTATLTDRHGGRISHPVDARLNCVRFDPGNSQVARLGSPSRPRVKRQVLLRGQVQGGPGLARQYGVIHDWNYLITEHQIPSDDMFAVVEAGEVYEPEAQYNQLNVVLFDDDAKDNRGSLQVRAREEAP